MRLTTIRTSETDTAAARIDIDEGEAQLGLGPTSFSERAVRATPIPGFADVGALLAEPNWRELVETAGTPRMLPLRELAPVIPRPGKIICVGLNYAKHIDEMGHDRPDVPTLFIKFPEALIGPFDDTAIPSFNAGSLDFEGEVAVVVGKHARHVRAAEAEAYIAGYAIINDLTNREMQNRTKQWHQGKSLAHSAGFGPWLDTDWRPGPAITTTVNGEKLQHSPTDDLVFTPEKLIEFISHIYPLAPGDVIATGTPDGVGHARDPRRYLADGDIVRVELTGLGAIENTVRVY